jgi:hypothetical protein
MPVRTGRRIRTGPTPRAGVVPVVTTTSRPADLERRPRLPGAAVWLSAALVLLTAGVWAAFTSWYPPFGPGSLTSARENVARLTDGIEDTAYLVTGRGPGVACAPGTSSRLESVPLRVSMLCRERVHRWDLTRRGTNTRPIYTCYPDEAVRHVG